MSPIVEIVGYGRTAGRGMRRMAQDIQPAPSAVAVVVAGGGRGRGCAAVAGAAAVGAAGPQRIGRALHRPPGLVAGADAGVFRYCRIVRASAAIG